MDHDNAVHRPGGAGVAKVSAGKVAWMVVLAAGVAGYSGAALSASASSGSASSVARRDADSSAQMCARLAESAIPDGTVTSAKWVDAVNGKPSETLPAHCLVEGVLASRTGRPAPVTVNGAASTNAQYGIHFQLRLPLVWAGRFFYQGGGGSDGVVLPATGTIPSWRDGPRALARGFAVVSSDAGHTADQNVGFGVDPQARVDYGYASIGPVTRAAKQLIGAFYGIGPKHSYFAGCSKGGQEAMEAMQRYGSEYDGIIAGDPGFRLPHAAIAQVADTQAFSRAAPRASDGRVLLGQAFSNADLNLVATAARARCGNSDGFDYRPDTCRFDPVELQCRAGQTEQCLRPAQVTALHEVFDGAKSSDGRPLYARWPYDSGIGSANWRQWKLGDSTNPSLAETLGAGSMQYVFSTPPRDTFDIQTVSLDDLDRSIYRKTPEYPQSSVEFMDADSLDLDGFRARGGKLLMYHGGSDPVFSVLDSIDYYRRLSEKYRARADAFARLYIVPGMNHCAGGDYALDSFDSLAAIVGWVERGTPPGALVAHAGSQSGSQLPAGMTRPLCPYPQTARYVKGDVNDASSFVCVGS
ncbi:feruloyl esterase [Robbsia andropogonis]|nr:tannase/feruloyl esterase family alpha/beta hydrolase [Robbsia andropogonis]MCP1120726.1 tannase/feruloyl esterase family alpha/beta hydrolase [Robbsia andropogonis]MCP1130460.1 tannase/feruloyl esterase family alpha/beta hydrolase [Robbsia andropogonis]